MDSDKEKESTLTPTAEEAIGDAARANVNAAVEVAKSAVSSFVDVFAGERKKPQRGKRRPTRKKATSKGAASKRGKAKRSAGGRRSAAASTRRATRKSPTKRAKTKRPGTRKPRSAAATRRVRSGPRRCSASSSQSPSTSSSWPGSRLSIKRSASRARSRCDNRAACSSTLISSRFIGPP